MLQQTIPLLLWRTGHMQAWRKNIAFFWRERRKSIADIPGSSSVHLTQKNGTYMTSYSAFSRISGTVLGKTQKMPAYYCCTTDRLWGIRDELIWGWMIWAEAIVHQLPEVGVLQGRRDSLLVVQLFVYWFFISKRSWSNFYVNLHIHTQERKES